LNYNINIPTKQENEEFEAAFAALVNELSSKIPKPPPIVDEGFASEIIALDSSLCLLFGGTLPFTPELW
jgi:hypothetical protein